jgi:hypothetical protein
MKRKATIVHCWATKFETLREEWESEHGADTFVGSPVWQATFAPGWRDGVCMRPMEHKGPCAFACDGEERKMAS